MKFLIRKQEPLMARDVTSVVVGGLCQITKKISNLWPLLLQGLFFILNYFLHIATNVATTTKTFLKKFAQNP
jgi:hypothetical protein